MQDYFYSLGDALFKQLEGDEQLLLGFNGEDSDFVRLNHNKIRQAGVCCATHIVARSHRRQTPCRGRGGACR